MGIGKLNIQELKEAKMNEEDLWHKETMGDPVFIISPSRIGAGSSEINGGWDEGYRDAPAYFSGWGV